MNTLAKRLTDAAQLFYDFGADDIRLQVDDDWNEPERDDDRGGYWINARLFVHDIDIEPNPCPAYTVWLCYDHRQDQTWTDFSDWELDETYVFDDDFDGSRARRAAFDRARYLRRGQEPWMFCAVRPKGLTPLPLRPPAPAAAKQSKNP